MTRTYNINDLQDTATTVLNELSSKTVLFYGAMGSGKTTLIKAMVKALSGKNRTSSPTFSIVNEYEIENDKIFHFDFYRIEDEIEAYDIGIEEYLYSNHYNFIEWPERLTTLLPQDADSIYLSINQDGSRSLKLNHTMNLTN